MRREPPQGCPIACVLCLYHQLSQEPPEGMCCCSAEEEEEGVEWAVKLPAQGGVTPRAFHFLPFLPFLPLPFDLPSPPCPEEA